MKRAHLICLREPDEDVLQAIRRVWPEEGADRVELNDMATLVSHTNGGKSVYELIAAELGTLDEEEPFTALIVRVGAAHHGYESRSLWDWLKENI